MQAEAARGYTAAIQRGPRPISQHLLSAREMTPRAGPPSIRKSRLQLPRSGAARQVPLSRRGLRSAGEAVRRGHLFEFEHFA
jgi:hypothetical protein